MRKLEKRAIICMTLAAVLFIGTGIFVFRFVKEGGEWATFYANQHIYNEGRLNIGKVYDINGVLLAENADGVVHYNDDYGIRRGTVHAVGDMDGNIATSALSAFKSDIVGYSLVTGTYSINGKGNDVKLNIDADVCKTAYEALGGRDGVVGVYNYKTGEIVCMVSSPDFDPADPPEIDPDDTSGIYINKFFSAKMIPGSIFKLVTSAAAIENQPDMDGWTAYCDGATEINGEVIRCTGSHGTVNFEEALANSCNCAFAHLTQEIGPTIMKDYVEKTGLTRSYNINGIHTAPGSFDFPDNAPLNLAWSGIGQYNDLVNPCSMMVYMGAIANGGKAAVPEFMHSVLPGAKMTKQMIKPETADELTSMMKNNVVEIYGEYNFPDLDIYAKSGTAEVYNKAPNAWFTGFIKNPDNPYAFIVCVENSGYGSSVAAPVANTVLQAVVNR